MKQLLNSITNKIRGHFIIIVLVLSALSYNSCDFLKVNDYFNETLKYDSIFQNKRNIERYLFAAAATFPDEGNIFGYSYTPGPMATDEGFTLFGENEFRGIAYTLGYVTPTNLHSLNTWNSMYIIIRKANTILSRIDEATDMTNLERLEIVSYTHFLRAYAYYHLAVKYGPVVIIGDDLLENNEKQEYYDRARATWDETVDYICNEFEKAAIGLPSDPFRSIAVSDFGRPSKGAAYGLVARLRLMQASPLYNPHPDNPAATTYFGDWKRSIDGVNYVSQEYDEEKWAVAAMAAKRIIDMDIFELHTVEKASDTPSLPSTVSDMNFPDGAGNIDPFRSYSDMFTGESLAPRIKEFVWARYSNQVRDYTRHSFPIDLGGWNGLGVTQKIIDNYRMRDGRTIEEAAATGDYNMVGKTGGSTSFSGYTLNSVSNMYANREMRFYASIGFSGRVWPCNSTSQSEYRNKTFHYEFGTNGGKNQSTSSNPNDYAITGYVLTKYIHPDDAWKGDGANRQQKPFPIIRYAEILLSYAEALNNLTSSYTITDSLTNKDYTLSRDVDEIRKAYNQVRFRAGLPGLTHVELANSKKIQELIERERMVEFLFEDRRYFDVRRWGKFEQTAKQPILGMNTEAPNPGYYTIIPVNHAKARNREVDKKLVLFPIALDEVRKAPSLDQNPGWQN